MVRLNVRSGLDSQIYDEEYGRLSQEMQQLKGKKAEFDNVEVAREKEIQKVKVIEKLIKDREEVIREFDEELFMRCCESDIVKVILNVKYI